MLDVEADKRLDELHKVSASLERRAWRLNVEVSPEWWENDDDWQIERGTRPDQLEYVRRRWLTDEGRERLKFLIQKAEEKMEDERRERRQKQISFWQTIITLIIGLTGWLAGLYAMVFRRSSFWAQFSLAYQALEEKMEKFYQEQVERIDRLMKIVEASDPYKVISGLSFYDVIVFTCQSMWHLKDWILNDPHFGASDQAELSKDIHGTRCLLVCADIANGSKHLSLSRPKVGGALSEATGLHLNTEKGICQEFYYVSCTDPADEFQGMEIRTLLRRCRDSWEQIINRHYLSQVDTWVAQQNA